MFFSASPPGQVFGQVGMDIRYFLGCFCCQARKSASWIVLVYKDSIGITGTSPSSTFFLGGFLSFRSSPTPGHKKKWHKMIGGRIGGAVLGVVVVETAWLLKIFFFFGGSFWEDVFCFRQISSHSIHGTGVYLPTFR